MADMVTMSTLKMKDETGNEVTFEVTDAAARQIIKTLQEAIAGKQPTGEYLTEETDPTVPAWAKAETKPTYTADEVGADPSGTADKKVSDHNTNTAAHNDIRILLSELQAVVTAFLDTDEETMNQLSELIAGIGNNKTSIEALTTGKVDVTDIIDNLETNLANKPLSAAQGVVLNNLISELRTAVNNISVPTKTSQLTNDSKFVTDTDLAAKGYAKQSDVDDLSEEIADIKTNGSSVPQAVIDGSSAVVDKALSRGTGNVLRFITWADAHHDGTNNLINKGTIELGQGIGEILKLMYVDFVSNLGDSAWGSYTDTTEEVREQLKQFNRFVSRYTKDELELDCEGNHDDANYSMIDNDGDGTTASTYKLTPSEIYSLIYAKNRNVVIDSEHYLDGYCYKDFEHLKTRVICLNTEQGTGDGGVVEGYQLKWFAETALNMSGKTDWNVITLAHHPLDWGMPTLFKDCVNIIEAFIKGVNFNYTTQNGTAITIDYSNKNCQYVGHFHGHTHAYTILKMQKYVSGSYVDINAWQVGIPNACYSRNNTNSTSTNERIKRFSTETTYNKSDVDGKRTSFTFVTVDLDNKVIYADNFGAGIDRMVSYAVDTVSYSITRNLTNCTSSSGVTSVIEGTNHTETLTGNTGHTLDGGTVTVTMGGVDVTSSVYSNGAISIGEVTGDIVITAVAVEKLINWLPLATTAHNDSTIYGGDYDGDGKNDGYKQNTRYSSSSGIQDNKTGYQLTGIIPATETNDIIRVKNVDLIEMCPVVQTNGTVGSKLPSEMYASGYEQPDSNGVYTFKSPKAAIPSATFAGIRFSGKGIDGDTIITINQEIPV